MLVQRLLAAINRLPIGERPIRFGADRLYADSLDRWVAAVAWSRGWRERRELELIARVVGAGMVAVDVGANIGCHTLTLARAVGATGRVHALEPDPRNFRLLERAVREAGLTQVRLHQAAASDRAGQMTLYLAAANRGDHRLVAAEEARERVVVAARPLDDLLASEPRVDFLKIDVQGSEVVVLRGLRETLARNPGLTMLCELSPDLLLRAGVGAEDFFAPLRTAGLRPHRLIGNGDPAPVSEPDAWSAAESSGYETIWLAP